MAGLRRRVERGLELHRQGAAPLLVLSGGGPVQEALIMRDIALAAGVPEHALLVEAASRDTLDNARECARLLRARGRHSILLVSDRTHLFRATLLFRLAGLAVVGRAGVRPASPLAELALALREALALPRSLVRALRRLEARQDPTEPQADGERRDTGQQEQLRDAGPGGKERHRR
jgi:uncharacterized SAM-binding protein YcdF (DUF218 family)